MTSGITLPLEADHATVFRIRAVNRTVEVCMTNGEVVGKVTKADGSVGFVAATLLYTEKEISDLGLDPEKGPYRHTKWVQCD